MNRPPGTSPPVDGSPLDGPPVNSPPVHPAAAQGFAAGVGAYERGRPDYPATAVAHLATALPIAPGALVLDVGAGTGKLTRLLVPTGAHLLALEPVAEMRAALRSLVPEAAVVAGAAEAIPLARDTVDAAVVAQAFHWFDGPAALAELHRVLRPGGGLGLVWNRRDEEVDWMAAVTAVLDEVGGDVPRHRDRAWLAAFEDGDLFAPPALTLVDHHHVVDLDRALDRLASVSFVAALPAGERAALLDRAAGIMRPHLDARGMLAMPYVTEVYVTRARPSRP